MSWSRTNRCAHPVREPIQYIERTRAWYTALGFEKPYVWADNSGEPTPFCRLQKSLSESRVAIITTAALFDPSKGNQGPGALYNGSAKFFTPYRREASQPDTRISHIAYDRKHTTAQDQRSWLPVEALAQASTSGSIGSAGKFFYGAPTNRSQRVTQDEDAPALLSMVREDAVDAVVLVPNCPVCHQSVTLVARHLEAHHIPTVIMGCARDIVETAGAPRFVFSDFPLGNGAGKPGDALSQASTLSLALGLLANAVEPVTVVNPQVWSEDHGWKDDYSNPEKLNAEELAARRAAFDQQKAAAKS